MFKYLNSSIYHSLGTSVELFTLGVSIIRQFILKILAKVVYLKVLPQMQFLRQISNFLRKKKKSPASCKYVH